MLLKKNHHRIFPPSLPTFYCASGFIPTVVCVEMCTFTPGEIQILRRPQAVTFGSNYSSSNQAGRFHSLLSSFSRSMIPHTLPPGFLFSATLFTTLCSVIVNSQSLTTTWHAYHQNHVAEKANNKACERYYNSSRPQSAWVLGNNDGSSEGLSEVRLWPGKVALLRL